MTLRVITKHARSTYRATKEGVAIPPRAEFISPPPGSYGIYTNYDSVPTSFLATDA